MAKDTKKKNSSKTDIIENGADLAPSAPTREIKEGELVWYNERKGYGFVKIEDTEIFLHRSTLDRFGLIRLLTGDRVSVSLTENEHGKVIQDLLTVERPVSPAPPMASAPADDEVRAVVKFSMMFAAMVLSLPRISTMMFSSIPAYLVIVASTLFCKGKNCL